MAQSRATTPARGHSPTPCVVQSANTPGTSGKSLKAKSPSRHGSSGTKAISPTKAKPKTGGGVQKATKHAARSPKVAATAASKKPSRTVKIPVKFGDEAPPAQKKTTLKKKAAATTVKKAASGKVAPRKKKTTIAAPKKTSVTGAAVTKKVTPKKKTSVTGAGVKKKETPKKKSATPQKAAAGKSKTATKATAKKVDKE